VLAIVSLAIWAKKGENLTGLAVVGNVVAFAATGFFLSDAAGFSLSVVWLVLALVTLAFLWFLSPRMRVLFPEKEGVAQGVKMLEVCYAVFLCLVIGKVLEDSGPFSTWRWLQLGAPLAVVGGAIGEFLKRRSLALTTLFFYLVVLGKLFEVRFDTSALLLWLPFICVLAHFVIAETRWSMLPRAVARYYLAPMTLLFSLFALGDVLARPGLGLVLLALFFGAWALWRGEVGMAFLCALAPLLFAAGAGCVFHDREDWLRYVPVLALLAGHAVLCFFFREKKDWLVLRRCFFASGLAFLVLMVSAHVLARFSGSGLTVAWALLAGGFFVVGLLLPCRPYRLAALGMLALAAGNVMLVDVMRLGSLGRILSFLTLGLILLLLGFFY
jgi:hypothetical protein